ncbi:MAG: flavin reductase family protein [Anderseniella sp.]
MSTDNGDSPLRQPFLDAMSQLTNTVCVVTTDGAAGRAGTTVTAMSPVSADSEAPSLLVCLHADSLTAKAIAENDVFAVNVLAEGSSGLADVFAGWHGAAGPDKFDGINHSSGTTGSAHLDDAVVVFDCRAKLQQPWGTHIIFIGEVTDVVINAPSQVLTYTKRNYLG